MTTTDLIGVPFDGYGRPGHQARAAAALREAGLLDAFTGREVVSGQDLSLPEPSGDRAPASGLMNEVALLAMVDGVHARVGAALAAGRFPLVYGGDCTALLGIVPALRDAAEVAGLVVADAHEDTTPLDASVDGEGANTEIGLLLGITGQLAPGALRSRLPALDEGALAVLGVGGRDRTLRRLYNLASLADRGVFVRTDAEVAADPAGVARAAVTHVAATASGWWLHTDLDVLRQDEFVAQRVPGDEDEAGGLTWDQLADLTAAALAAGGCRGWSIPIYDPEQDPDGHEARRIVRFVADVAPALP